MNTERYRINRRLMLMRLSARLYLRLGCVKTPEAQGLTWEAIMNVTRMLKEVR